MRKFQTAISFMIIIAVTIVVIGLFAIHKPKTESRHAEPAQQQAEILPRILLCI